MNNMSPPASRGRCVAGVLLTAVMLCMVEMPANGQTRTSNPPSDRTVPGFGIADSSLMSVEHIDPLHSTSLTLFSTLRRDDLLPRDLAMELLPWLPTSREAPEPILRQFERMERLNGSRAIQHYLAFSIAISQAATRVEEGSLSHVAIGARTFLVSGSPNPELAALMRDYRAATAELDKAELDAAQRPRDAPIDREADEKLALLALRSQRLVEQIASSPRNRLGFLVEAGSALLLRVPNNRLSQAAVGRYGLWLNPIYRFERLPMDVAGLARVISESPTSSRLLDLGGRVGARRGGIFYSLEALGRHRFTDRPLEGDDLYYGRLIGGIAYGFNRSSQVHFSFGKNFSHDFSDSGSLLVSFGMTIGLGELPLGTVPAIR